MTKKKLKLKKSGIIFLLLVGVFGFSIFKISIFFLETHNNNELKEDLIKEVITEIKPDNNTDDKTLEEPPKFSVDFTKLLSKNSDTKGG